MAVQGMVDDMVLQAANLKSLTDCALLLKSLTSDRCRPNLLVICDDRASEAVVRDLTHWCAQPFRCCAFPGSLALPPDKAGTLLLYAVNRMTLAQQIALYDWMNPLGQGPQIISMTTAALQPLVKRGYFLEGLFHRLSVVQLDVPAL